MNYFNSLSVHSKNIAFEGENSEKYTYKEFLNLSNSIGLKIKCRSLVMVLCSNEYECIAGCFGFWIHNSVTILADNCINSELYESVINTYKPKYLYADSSYENLYSIMDLLYCGKKYNIYVTRYEDNYDIDSRLMNLVSTSGTTGTKKYIKQSYANLNSNTKNIVKYLNIKETDKAITTMPFSYSYGLSIINTHLFCGATIILNEKSIVDKNFWNILQHTKATTFGGVPYHYEILSKFRYRIFENTAIKYLTQAGGKLDEKICHELVKELSKINIKIIFMYGQAEATSRISYVPWSASKEKYGSIGIPIPYGKMWLIDSSGNVIKNPLKTGELCYKGSNVCLGYSFSCNDLNKGDDNNGVIKTGDLAYKDNDGYYYITGRKKRFIKYYGNSISLDDIEYMLKENNYNVACVGEDNYICIYTTSKKDLKIIYDFSVKYFKFNKQSFETKHIEKFPRLENNKLDYNALKAKQ